MTEPHPDAAPVPLKVVLADANVLYSRVLRDYLLYSSANQLISVRWSQRILDETTKHLILNFPKFDDAAADTLVRLLEEYFPLALVEPGPEHYEQFSDLHMPDEDVRHVVAACVRGGWCGRTSAVADLSNPSGW